MAEYSTKTPPQNPTTSYTTTDHLGSPRVITDALGQVKSRRDFMPFGEELTINVGERSEGLKYGTPDDIRQKFTGYQKDEETKLDFAEARMYENRHARFTAVDPLLASGRSANPQTFNRFVYVLNNPLVMVDTNGLYPVYFFTEKDGSVTFSTKKWNKDWERYKGPKVEKVDTGMYGTAGKGLKYVITQTAIRRVEYFTSNKSPVERAQDSDRLDKSQRLRLDSMADASAPIPRAIGEFAALAIMGGLTVASCGTDLLLLNAGALTWAYMYPERGSPGDEPSATEASIESERRAGVAEAWKQEAEMVRRTGQGTRAWTPEQMQELLQRGKVSGFEGHHINDVKRNPQEARNPNNVKFVDSNGSRAEHLAEHDGDFRKPSSGPMVDRIPIVDPIIVDPLRGGKPR